MQYRQIGEDDLLGLIHLHIPAQFVLGQKVAVVGGLRVLPLPVDEGQVEGHGLQLLDVGRIGRILPLQLVQQPVEGHQIADAGEAAAHPAQVAGLNRPGEPVRVTPHPAQLLRHLAAERVRPQGEPTVAGAQVQAVEQVEHQHAQAHQPIAV